MVLDMAALSGRPAVGEDSGEASLKKLGYKQELSRGFSFVNNAAMSFRWRRLVVTCNVPAIKSACQAAALHVA